MGSAVDPAGITRSSRRCARRDSAAWRSRPSTACAAPSRGSCRTSRPSGCGCSSTRCARRGGSVSASTWRPAPAGRSAGRGSATRDAPRALAYKTWTRRRRRRLPSRCGCDRRRSSARSGTRPASEAGRAVAADRATLNRSRRRREPEPAGAGARTGALSEALPLRRWWPTASGDVIDLTRASARTARSTGLRRRDVDAVRRVPRLARQAGRARGARRRRQRHRSLLARRDSRAISHASTARSPARDLDRPPRVLQRLLRSGRRHGTGRLDAGALRRVPAAARVRPAPAPAGAARAGDTATRARACSPTIARRSRICCSTRSHGVGAPGRGGAAPSCATRRTGRRPTCSICTPRATFPRPKAPRFRASKWATLRRRTSPAGGSSRPRPRPGSASTSARRSPTSAPAVDRFFVAGVNHIVYHGTAYSPEGEPWPGWLFYAAVEFNPRNPWWRDFRALNQYVARVQSFLQAGTPGSRRAALLPVLRFARRPRQRRCWRISAAPTRRPKGTAFEAAGAMLQQRGFTYDYISDRQLRRRRGRRRPAR